MRIQIETSNKTLVQDLVGPEVKRGETDEVVGGPKGVSMTHLRTRKLRALDAPQVIEIAVQLSSNVACGLLASWLYEKLKGRTKRLRIEGRDVPVETAAIEEALVSSRGDQHDEVAEAVDQKEAGEGSRDER